MPRFVVILIAALLIALLCLRLWPALQPTAPATHGRHQMRERTHAETEAEPAQAEAPEAVVPAPRPPEFAPGQEVTIALTEPPAPRYLSEKRDENDAFYARLVDEESGGKAVFDPSLGRAAREFVYQFSNLGMDPPSDVRTFLTNAAGAVAGDTLFQHMRSNSDAEAALRRAIRSVVQAPTKASGLLHVGVGEVYQPGASLSRHIGVVGTRLGIDLEPLDRQVALGQAWRVRGRMRASWRNLEALVLRPGGELITQPVAVTGDRLEVTVAGEPVAGGVELQIVGDGPEGPGKLVQVRVEVGQPLPTQYVATLPPDETRLKTADQAAAYAMQLLNADRQKHGLPLLSWDERLAQIAKDHSADMRDNGFFGHVSPTTGMHPDRLARAKYLTIASAENVAHNPSIWEAELGLMHSLGHRRNILDPTMTHVGVGVAGAEDDQGRRRWWVTQLFAKPTPQLSPADAVALLRRHLAKARDALGLEALTEDEALGGVARDALADALNEHLQEASSQALALAQARHAVRGRLRVWTALTADLAQLKWPESVDMPSSRQFGLAAAQRADGRVAVVLLVAETQD